MKQLVNLMYSSKCKILYNQKRTGRRGEGKKKIRENFSQSSPTPPTAQWYFMEIRKQTQFSRVAWEQYPLRISRPYKWWYLFIPENETKKARVTLHFWNIAFSLPTRRRGMEQKWRGTVPDQFLRITIVFGFCWAISRARGIRRPSYGE